MRAQALDNMKQQKGYCAVTRTTHICSGTERNELQSRTTRRQEEEGTTAARGTKEEGGAVATGGTEREQEMQKRSKEIKSDGEKESDGGRQHYLR